METWLNSAVSDNLKINDIPYVVFRKDRNILKVSGRVHVLTNNKTINAVSL